ncbi:MAG: hypothetical protein JXR95_13675 [Deltaproteobacteria bacterium]|nr:hypothetical protein [Deltaproteobacteria bacterium]
MFRLPSPTEGGGFQEREAKVPIHELAQFGNPLVENLGSPFSVRVSIGTSPKSMIKFPGIPTIPVEFPVPELDSQRYVIDGWNHCAITVYLSKGMALLEIKGVFGISSALEVHSRFQRTDSGETAEDMVTVTDSNGQSRSVSFFELLQIRLKSGDPKYARFSDQYPTLDVEGIMAMLTRYLKDFGNTSQGEGEA